MQVSIQTSSPDPEFEKATARYIEYLERESPDLESHVLDVRVTRFGKFSRTKEVGPPPRKYPKMNVGIKRNPMSIHLMFGWRKTMYIFMWMEK